MDFSTLHNFAVSSQPNTPHLEMTTEINLGSDALSVTLSVTAGSRMQTAENVVYLSVIYLVQRKKSPYSPPNDLFTTPVKEN